MPEIIPNHVPSPRTLLAWDGTAYRPITIDAAGHVQIDVLTSGLPLGAATALNQTFVIAALQRIDDLQHALQSVNTDALQVRGEDQLWSYNSPLGAFTGGAISGADGFFDSPTPPAGQVWVVTTVRTVDNTSPTTSHFYRKSSAGWWAWFHQVVQALAAGTNTFFNGWLWLEPGDVVQVHYYGALAGDTCGIDLTGHIMTKEV